MSMNPIVVKVNAFRPFVRKCMHFAHLMVNLHSTNTWLVELLVNCLWGGLLPNNNIAIVIVASDNTEAAPCGFLPLFPSWRVFIPCTISTNSLIFPMNLEVIGLLILIPIKVTMKFAIRQVIPSTLPSGMWIRTRASGFAGTGTFGVDCGFVTGMKLPSEVRMYNISFMVEVLDGS